MFGFNQNDSVKKIEFKFNLWIRKFFVKYLKDEDAPFHQTIDQDNIKAYKGLADSFTDIAFRGGAKTARTKLFIAFVICNDKEHYRRYIKVLAADGANSKQITVDVYNMLVSPKVKELYPEIFQKTIAKREETMSAFRTSTGVKMTAGTVGTEQRGALQEDARPDFIWFEDFENRTTIRSAVKTIAIWDNMEEARTGLSKDGACVYTCNYICEQGNVHKLVMKESERNIVLIVPIIDKKGKIAWSRYSREDIEAMRSTDDDFEGERLCEPSASKEVYFDREILTKMDARQPVRESATFKIFHEYDPSNRYGSGHDIAGGVGLDSSTSVFIGFDTMPSRVVGTFKSNLIKPEAFGDEIYREQEIFGGCIAGIENNKFDSAILKAKMLGANLYKQEGKGTRIQAMKKADYGWNTNSLTKSKMLAALSKAVEDGLIDLSDQDLINEVKSYTRNDLIENITDPRLATRHFDLLIACAIAWQMKDFATVAKERGTSFTEDNRPKFK